MNLWETYNTIHPGFLDRINSLDESSAKKIIKRLKSENDKLNFLSTIAEFLFLEFFHQNGYVISYENKYTITGIDRLFNPDFTLHQFGQDIIAEVFKLNTTVTDIRKNDFVQYFINRRVEIKKSIHVMIRVGNGEIDLAGYEKEAIFGQLEKWLDGILQVNDTLEIDTNLQFVILQTNTGKNNIGIASHYSVQFEIGRFDSPRSNLVEKINKYQVLLEHLGKPYIICLMMNLDTAINETDVFWKLYGDLVYHRDTTFYRSELNGLLYSNENARKYLNGILLMINGSFFYFHNFQDTILNPQNQASFYSYQFYLKDWFPSKQEWYESIIESDPQSINPTT